MCVYMPLGCVNKSQAWPFWAWHSEFQISGSEDAVRTKPVVNCRSTAHLSDHMPQLLEVKKKKLLEVSKSMEVYFPPNSTPRFQFTPYTINVSNQDRLIYFHMMPISPLTHRLEFFYSWSPYELYSFHTTMCTTVQTSLVWKLLVHCVLLEIQVKFLERFRHI